MYVTACGGSVSLMADDARHVCVLIWSLFIQELDKLKSTVQALDRVFKTDTDYEHLSWKVSIVRWLRLQRKLQRKLVQNDGDG